MPGFRQPCDEGGSGDGSNCFCIKAVLPGQLSAKETHLRLVVAEVFQCQVCVMAASPSNPSSDAGGCFELLAAAIGGRGTGELLSPIPIACPRVAEVRRKCALLPLHCVIVKRDSSRLCGCRLYFYTVSP